MLDADTGVNPLRSLIFIRTFTKRAIRNTDIRVNSQSADSQLLDKNVKIDDPRELSLKLKRNSLEFQKGRSPQARFIDLFI